MTIPIYQREPLHHLGVTPFDCPVCTFLIRLRNLREHVRGRR